MQLQDRVEGIANWGKALSALVESVDFGSTPGPLEGLANEAYRLNPWFVPANTVKAVAALASILNEKNVKDWLSQYAHLEFDRTTQKRVGIIMAGNIPAVGFHDLLCVLVSGHHALVKCASDDSIIIPFLLDVLVQLQPGFRNQFTICRQFDAMDAVIATGSNNSARYFDYYFGKYPHIIRRNRNSVAVLSGGESDGELMALGEDILRYFGLGCRNVSKLFVPDGYQFNRFFRAMDDAGNILAESPGHGHPIYHNKYMNNYDYHNALFLLNNEAFLTNNFLLLRENTALSTPVSVLHYERYSDPAEVKLKLEIEKDNIQCVVGNSALPFGSSQQPGLNDYADGIDTISFLLNL